MRPRLLPLLILFAWLPQLSANDEAVEASVQRFFQALQSGVPEASILESSALSQHTTPATRANLSTRLKVFARQMREENLQPSILQIDRHDPWAVVHCQLQSPLDLRETRNVFLVLNQQEGTWKVGPNLNSFANIHKPFNLEKRQALRQLEIKALQRQRHLQGKLQEVADQQFEKILAAAVSKDELKKSSPEQIFRNFIQACRAKDYPAVLAYLGEREENLAEDHDLILASVKKGLLGEDLRQQWQLLTDPRHAWVIKEQNGGPDDCEIILTCFTAFPLKKNQLIDNLIGPQDEVFRFELFRERDQWRVFLPTRILHSHSTDSVFANALMDDSGVSQEKNNLGENLQKQFPTRFHDTPEALIAGLTNAYREQHFEQFLHLIDHQGIDKKKLLSHYHHLREHWKKTASIQTPTTILHHKTLNETALLFGITATSPDRLTPTVFPLLLTKKRAGWVVSHRLDKKPTNDPLRPGALQEIAGLLKELPTQRQQLQEAETKKALQNFPVWNLTAPTPKNKDSSLSPFATLIQNYHHALRKGKIQKARDLTLCLPPAKGSTLLKSHQRLLKLISRHSLSTQKSPLKVKLLALHSEPCDGTDWIALSCQLTSPDGKTHSSPLYLIGFAPDGAPRLIPQSELHAPLTRTDELYNEYTLQDLTPLLNEEQQKTLQALLKKHVTLLKPTGKNP